MHLGSNCDCSTRRLSYILGGTPGVQNICNGSTRHLFCLLGGAPEVQNICYSTQPSSCEEGHPVFEAYVVLPILYVTIIITYAINNLNKQNHYSLKLFVFHFDTICMVPWKGGTYFNYEHYIFRTVLTMRMLAEGKSRYLHLTHKTLTPTNCIHHL